MRFITTLASLLCVVGSYAIPRPEYPRPQFQREAWVNLNGEWSYALDPVKTGWEHGYHEGKPFEGKITGTCKGDISDADSLGRC